MIQGIIGAFCIRIPVSYLMSKILPVSLFKVGLATPMSPFVQIILCVTYFIILSGAFCIRIPVSYLMSKILPVSLFKVGLATPMSPFVQIILCVTYFIILSKKLSKEETPIYSTPQLQEM